MTNIINRIIEAIRYNGRLNPTIPPEEMAQSITTKQNSITIAEQMGRTLSTRCGLIWVDDTPVTDDEALCWLERGDY